jgi:hypothetical protein
MGRPEILSHRYGNLLRYRDESIYESTSHAVKKPMRNPFRNYGPPVSRKLVRANIETSVVERYEYPSHTRLSAEGKHEEVQRPQQVRLYDLGPVTRNSHGELSSYAPEFGGSTQEVWKAFLPACDDLNRDAEPLNLPSKRTISKSNDNRRATDLGQVSRQRPHHLLTAANLQVAHDLENSRWL